MFTFIKRLQELLAHLKKHKGLWFTTLFVLSIIGIFISMYVIMTMTNRVSEKVYQSMFDSYELKLNTKIETKQEEFKKIAAVIAQDELLLGAIETNNSAVIEKFKKSLNEEFIKSGFTSLSVDFASVANREKPLRNTLNTIISSKRTLFGAEVLDNGAFFVYLIPLQKNEVVYGVLEIKESVHAFKIELTKEGSQYLFLLDRKMLPILSLEEKADKYKEINENYAIKQIEYNTKFASTINEVDFEKIKQLKYGLDENYFRVVKKITDINGVDIGLMVSGESIDASGGFVNIAGDMTNTVTTVALGLVISIILFLF
ncbi:hypothetical protein [Sulfurimonas sp.]|uniref:hypothetical protein n=1 Tax=Sulfurimonas sp. TaxID=2022749 RepID=UPI003D102A18